MNNVSQLNSEFSFYLSLVKDWLVWANRTGVGVTMAENEALNFSRHNTLAAMKT